MRVLIIGSGGREHALAWKIRKSEKVTDLYCIPGNGGTAREGENIITIMEKNLQDMVDFAKKKHIDLVIPGPEAPLTLGIVDMMRDAGISAFGPDKWCAQLEGSKSFAKKIMKKAGVATSNSAVFQDSQAAKNYIKKHGTPIVIKADGLAAGKGVIVASTEREALDGVDHVMRDFGEAGHSLVIEDCLVGEEVSLLAFCSGEMAIPLPSAQDHKAAFDGDTGPNTGGMGAYSPAPILPDSNLERITDLTIRPILQEMKKQGHPFTGILYAGLMMTKDGPKVLEYNVRFGDPECQPLLMRLESDLTDLMLACINGTLADIKLSIRPESALGVVLTASGYPGSYSKGMPIEGIDSAESLPDVKVFQAGTRLEKGQLVSNGGRVLCVTALGKDLATAKNNAYNALSKIHMPDSRFRTDIGLKGIRHLCESLHD